MRLVLLGPPASGKGTQGATLATFLGIPKIATGDMLRDARAKGTALGAEAESYMSRGQLVPDALVVGLVEARLTEPDAQAGFILDGFPRTLSQAETLDAALKGRGTPLSFALQVDVARELLVERAVLRRTDKRTGLIYHLKYNPPPPDAELEHRADDREETVASRLDQYEAISAAVLPFYASAGILKRVDGVGSVAEVRRRIHEALGLPVPNP